MDSLPTDDKMENFIIAFDVDGTLISNINENITQERRVHGQVYPFDAANTQVVEFLILCFRIFKNVKGGCLERWSSRVSQLRAAAVGRLC